MTPNPDPKHGQGSQDRQQPQTETMRSDKPEDNTQTMAQKNDRSRTDITEQQPS
jgi:hypothetical protein